MDLNLLGASSSLCMGVIIFWDIITSCFLQFVAHPYSQLMLNSVLYNRLGGWEDFGFLKKMVYSVIYTLLLPILALFYFLAPNSQVSKMLRKPFFKFVSHAGSFCSFLILLILSSIQDFLFDVLQFSVVGRCFSEIFFNVCQSFALINCYLTNWWVFK